MIYCCPRPLFTRFASPPYLPIFDLRPHFSTHPPPYPHVHSQIPRRLALDLRRVHTIHRLQASRRYTRCGLPLQSRPQNDQNPPKSTTSYPLAPPPCLQSQNPRRLRYPCGIIRVLLHPQPSTCSPRCGLPLAVNRCSLQTTTQHRPVHTTQHQPPCLCVHYMLTQCIYNHTHSHLSICFLVLPPPSFVSVHV